MQKKVNTKNMNTNEIANLETQVALYKEIIHTTDAIILILNLDLTINSTSKGTEKILGYKYGELNNTKWFDKVVVKEKYPEYEKNYKEFIASNNKTRIVVAPVVCKDGSIKTVSWRTNKLYNNKKLIGTVAIGKDITELTIKVEKLKANETRFKNLAEQMLHPVAFVTIDGNFVFLNKAFTKKFGYSMQEFPNIKTLINTTKANEIEKREGIQYWQNEIKQIFNTKKTVTNKIEVEVKSGEKIQVSYSATFADNFVYYVYNDITLQLKKEKKLIATKEVFKKVAENTPIAIAGCNATTFEITFLNNKFKAQFGYNKNQLKHYKDWRQYIVFNNEKERIAAQTIWRKIASDLITKKKYKTKTLERNFLLKDNTIGTFEIGLTYDAGTIYAFFYDITERKKAENKLRESESRFRNLAENLPVPVLSLHAKKGLVFANQKQKELIGHNNNSIKTPNDFISKIIENEKYPNSREKYLNKLKILKNNTKNEPIILPTQEMDILCLDGVIRTFEISETIFGEVLYAIFHDITEQNTAKALLIKSEQKFRELAENTPLAIGSYDATGKTIFVNKYLTEITGYTIQDIPNIDAWYKKTQPNIGIRKEYKNYWNNLVNEYKKSSTKEAITIKATSYCKNIGFKHFSYSFSIQNNITYILLVDIDEQEKAKRALEKSHQELRNLASHIQNVREEERKNIAREIHDELGQQLTGIKMDISSIFKKINAQKIVADVDFKKALADIDFSVKTVRKISTQLRPSALDDLGIIAAIEWLVQDFKTRTNINCIFNNLVGNFVFCKEVESNFFRIIQESLTNIIRHSKAKNVLIEISIVNHCLLLTINDNGVGFNQNSSKQTLGIIGMKERVLMINGKFEINGIKNKGTSIKITIPMTNH